VEQRPLTVLVAQKLEEQPGVEVVSDVDWDSSRPARRPRRPRLSGWSMKSSSRQWKAVRATSIWNRRPSGIKIRYRIDGVLQPQPTPPEINRFHAAIISRLEDHGSAEHRRETCAQDGRIKLKVANREVDVRVSIIPMLHGEGIVLRILDKDVCISPCEGSAWTPTPMPASRKLIELPHGILLVTGPTGSGKTTTLYSALDEIKSEDTKIITTEDPIEYHLDGINQIQVTSEGRAHLLVEPAEHPAARPGRDPGG